MSQYREFIQVAPRFTRSVNVERDFENTSALDGYVITSTAHDLVLRIGRTLSRPMGDRAWTLTGPYGSGKSAFGLFAANLFGPAEESGLSARSLLRDQFAETHSEL